MDLWNLAFILNVFNILMLLVLLWVYLKNYFTVKSKFSLGLIIFAMLLLFHNLANIYFQITMMEPLLFESAYFACLLNGLEAIGLLSLVYVTWKPGS